MRVRLADVDPAAEERLPPAVPDESGVGVNYADAYIKPIKGTLDDGRKVSCKRRGLKITLKVGDETGEGLLRRLAHGPDARTIVHEALREAARGIGAEWCEEDGAHWLVAGA